MKKNTLIAILLLFTITVFSQTEKEKKQIIAQYDLKKLNKLEEKFSNIYKKQKKEALEYAAKHNIKTVIKDEEGNISTLQRIKKDGTLIYYKAFNEGAAITTSTTSLYEGGSLNLKVEGQGMEVGVWDESLVRSTHELLEGRVTQLDDASFLSDHATHVSGTLIGSEVPINGQGRGMAFKANLLAFDYNNDIPEMAAQAAEGLLVSNHSYGIDPEAVPNSYFGYYDDSAQAADELAYNAPNYLIVYAAGNERNDSFNTQDNGYDLIAGSSLAKNVLTVGAVEQVDNYTSPSSVTMSSFSSWGPSDDGRIKPDISGKGVNVISSIATNDEAYASFNGTSMASPNVAGSLLLLQQLNRNLSGGFLKSATVKAIAIHTALETGVSDGPDYQYGWGLLNMEAAASVLLNSDFKSIVEENTLNNQEIYNKTVVPNGEEPLVVTIVWTDPEGDSIDFWNLTEDDDTPMLVNDLDLRVEDENGTVFYPWKLNPANPSNAATTGDNSVDNVEKIEIENPQGEYTISVIHKGALVNSFQDFSIVVSGVAESQFTFIPNDTYQTFCSEGIGEFSLNYSSLENFSESITFSVSGLPEGITSDFSSNGISQDQEVNLFLDNLNTVPAGEYSFTVTATDNQGTILSKDLTFNILEPLADFEGLFPSENMNDVVLNPILTWENLPDSESYFVEVSKDSNFGTIDFSATTEENSIETSELDPNTNYYWRVNASNSCYNSEYSEGNFKTISIECNSPVYAEDTPIVIDEAQPNFQQSTITITEDMDIEDINVYVEIQHSYLGDLAIYLTSPSGTEIGLIDGVCDNGDNMEVIFDDSGDAYNCSPNTPSLSGVIKPLDDLNSLIGENVIGNWTLTVLDFYQGDGGSIENFGIEFCGYAAPTMSVNNQSVDAFKIFPNPTENAFSIHGLKETSSLAIFDINGRKLIHVPSIMNNQKIDVSSLQSGVYFVNIASGSNTFVTKKLIVN